MAEAERKAVAGMEGLPGVTPNATPDEDWRRTVAGNYTTLSGSVTAPIILVFYKLIGAT